MRKRYALLGGTAALVLVLDQASKWLVMQTIPEHRAITVIQGFFDLVNIRNRGAAFGFLNRSDIEWQFWLFLAATLVAVAAIISLVRNAHDEPWLVPALGLVVDFLDFYWKDWHWPAFNLADSAILTGAVLACFLVWRKPLPAPDSRSRMPGMTGERP